VNRLIYHRQARTTHSEQYEVMDGAQRLGHLDVHFGTREVYATLVLDDEPTDQTVNDIIEDIDENVVLSSDVARDDFVIRVYVGREVGLYSDELLRDEFVADGSADLDDA